MNVTLVLVEVTSWFSVKNQFQIQQLDLHACDWFQSCPVQTCVWFSVLIKPVLIVWALELKYKYDYNRNALHALNLPKSRKHSGCMLKPSEPFCKQLVATDHWKSRPVSSVGQSVVLITPRSRVRSPYGPYRTGSSLSVCISNMQNLSFVRQNLSLCTSNMLFTTLSSKIMPTNREP